MRRRTLVVTTVAGVVLLTAISTITASAGGRAPASHQGAHVIRALGQEDFEPNALIFSTFRFDPERSFPHAGDTVRLVDADRSEVAPHTLTLVRQGQLPTTFDEVLFGCEACNRALDAHFATDPPTRRVGLADGLNAPGDSMLIFPGQSIGATLTAPSGSIRYFLCAFHPWMQGRLVIG
jgi:plastocyanin